MLEYKKKDQCRSRIFIARKLSMGKGKKAEEEK